jgi:hypothetical protein
MHTIKEEETTHAQHAGGSKGETCKIIYSSATTYRNRKSKLQDKGKVWFLGK